MAQYSARRFHIISTHCASSLQGSKPNLGFTAYHFHFMVRDHDDAVQPYTMVLNSLIIGPLTTYRLSNGFDDMPYGS